MGIPLAFAHSAVELHAARFPDTVAVIEPGTARTTTYGELVAAVATVSSHLDVRGRPVAVATDGRLGALTALLAVLRAGGTYLPLDPAAPVERLRTLVAGAGAAAVLVDSERLQDRLTGLGAERLGVDQVPRPGTTSASTRPVHPEELAYVVHTSGSTGGPKAVGISHRALATHLTTVVECFELARTDRVLQFAAPHVDVSIEQMLAPLVAGASLVLPERAVPEPSRLLRLLVAEAVTVANLPAGYWRELTGALERHGWPTGGVLRLMISGSDRMPPAAARVWRQHAPAGVRLLNAYGPTEATITATVHEVAGEPDDTVPIGTPLDGRTAYVLDGRLGECAIGIMGELYLGGAGIARGYLDRPAATAGRFVPDPFGGLPGVRLYRTGDLVRRRPDGQLEFLGRVDEQVKVRGFRIEPGEVRSALSGHPAVRDCEVVPVPGTDGDTRLVAYAVAAESTDPQQLRKFLVSLLPAPLVPAELVLLDALPLTPEGKVDRAALPTAVPPAPAAAPTADFRTATERLLAEIWVEVLGRADIGPLDSFLELGGDSLAAVRVAARLVDRLGIAASPHVIAQAATLRAAAADLDGATDLEAPPGPGRERPAVIPLGPGQRALWLLDRWRPELPTYNETWVHTGSGPVDPDRLAGALDAILARHEALRTVFPAVDGEPRQVVRPPSPVPLAVRDLGNLEPVDRPAAVRAAAARAARRPIDLAAGPLLTAELLRWPDAGWALVTSTHHAVWDELSLRVFERELGELYAGSALPKLPVQYADHALEWAGRHGEAFEGDLAYWRRELAGAPVTLALPTDRPAPSGVGANLRFPVLAATAERIRRLARSAGTTTYAVLLSVFDAWLYSLTGERDLVVCSPASTRDRVELEQLIGYFVGILPMRATVDGRMGFRHLVDRVRDGVLAALAHRGVPFDDLVRELNPDRPLDRSPFAQVMFGFHPELDKPLRLGAATATRHREPTGTAKFDLTWSVFDDGHRLRGEVEYDTGLLDEATIRRWLRHWDALLEAVLAAPDRALNEVVPAPPPAPVALPRPAGGSLATGGAAGGALERVLAGIWANVLAVDEVGPADDFFLLGGHSLSAVRVVNRAVTELELPYAPQEVLRALLRARTVGGMASALLAMERVGAAAIRDGRP